MWRSLAALVVGKSTDHAGAPPDLSQNTLERVVNRYEDHGARSSSPDCFGPGVWCDHPGQGAPGAREFDRLGEDLAVLDREISERMIEDPSVKRLLTITGININVAAGLVAAIGDIRRFSSPQKLVSYVELNPRVRQTGLGLAQHGRISKRGRSHARAMLVEAAWAASKAPGPLRSFFLRIRARRGHQVAAVAVARKLAVLCRHLLTKYADY